MSISLNTIIIIAKTISRHYGYIADARVADTWALIDLCDRDDEGWADYPDPAVVQMIVNELNARFGQFAKFGMAKMAVPGESYEDVVGFTIDPV